MSEYLVKEIHLTLQGEGANTGRAVVLLRFAGCNLSCPWCDTDHSPIQPGIRGGVYSNPDELVNTVLDLWPSISDHPVVLCTGGEPLLQLDRSLIDRLKRRNVEILLETNGTKKIPRGIDWVCVSPKDDHAVVKEGDEVKLVWPSKSLDPDLWIERDFSGFWLQPLYGIEYEKNLAECIRYCMEDPRWRLSLQTHRFTGIP